MTTVIRILAAALLAASATAASAAPGGPIVGTVVKGGKNPGGNMFERPTGSDGAAPLGALAAGSYWVSVTGGRSAPPRQAVTVSIGDRDRATRVVSVRPGAESEHIAFEVKDKAMVRVTVTEPLAEGPVRPAAKAADAMRPR